MGACLGSRLIRIGLSFGIFFLCCLAGSQTLADWRREWEKTLYAAEKEGKLTFYSSSAYALVFRHFQKKYPRIEVVSWTGRGSQNGARIMAERRAGKYLPDLWIMGRSELGRILNKALRKKK